MICILLRIIWSVAGGGTVVSSRCSLYCLILKFWLLLLFPYVLEVFSFFFVFSIIIFWENTDKLLQDEFDVVTYRILAYLLLGIVRIYSRKVDYMLKDCNEVLLQIKNFVVSNKDANIIENLCAPYFSITLPERFELDAFDLDIGEDITGGNVRPSEEITLKDGMWKSRDSGNYSLGEYHPEEDTFPAAYNVNEDVRLPYIMEFDIGISTSRKFSLIHQSSEKSRGDISSQHERMDLQVTRVVGKEPPGPITLSYEVHQAGKKLATGKDEMHGEASMQQVWDDSFFQEACLNLEIFTTIGKEPVNPTKLCNEENHQTDGQNISVPHLLQSENEVHKVVEENCNFSHLEASIEKLQVRNYYNEECVNMRRFCVVEEPPKKSKQHSEGQSSDPHPMKFSEVTLSGNDNCQVVGNPSTAETTPKSKFPNPSGATTPEFLCIRTPATKEHPCPTRKRKCIIDDVIVFPNNVIKQCIENSSDLVKKRRKAPCSAFAAWTASRVSSLPHGFLEPLISCTSLELRSLFSASKFNIPELVESAELPEKLASECPNVGGMEETREVLIDLDIAESHSAGISVAAVEPPEKLNMSECPPLDGVAENGELSERVMLNFSGELESPTVGRLVMRPEKLIVPKSPSVSLEQTALAPETPIRNTSSLRAFESPERPEISFSYEPGLEDAEREEYRTNVLGFDVSVMFKDMNSYEVDKPDYRGLSERTRFVARYLKRCFIERARRKEAEMVNLSPVLKKSSKKEGARLFYEILVLKSKGYVDVQQENSYDDILVWKASQWDDHIDCVQF
ncbi:hypothetical protein K2173_020924 [Erythroxylum novogranatense]|uniref:Sister chromatid cohesion 1 protein 2 n=1 Tax=Erythroxylum novogranatense TaxID=1862640 RepID=A0AAV8TPZ8_9ROSI|nr:hypothetical protein K2173_020924 [Erythroxylum novogranatense]